MVKFDSGDEGGTEGKTEGGRTSRTLPTMVFCLSLRLTPEAVLMLMFSMP